NTMLTFLQDIPGQFNVIRNAVALGYRSTEGAWYFQDEMKLRSSLTLRLGLRHEMTDGWNEVTGRCTNYRFDKDFVSSTQPASVRALCSRRCRCGHAHTHQPAMELDDRTRARKRPDAFRGLCGEPVLPHAVPRRCQCDLSDRMPGSSGMPQRRHDPGC